MIVDFLANRTWRNIRVVALAYNMRFHTHQNKAEGFAYVQNALLNEGRLEKLMRNLSDQEHKALVSLQANDGSMPRHHWERAFGKIRPYKPWREDCPKYPWKKPASVAEKLWLWGVVEIVPMPSGKPDEVALVKPVLALLPPLPRPQPKNERVRAPSLAHAGDLRADLAIFMGKLMGENPKLTHGRWLPPTFIKSLSKHTLHKEDTRFLRSELKSGRIKTLHYIGLVAGLLSVQNNTLQPTISGWAWLKNPDLSLIWSAIRDDLRQRESLWERFRFPEINRRVWDALLEQLDDCTSGQTYHTRDLIEAIHLRVPDQSLRKVPKLLRTLFTWMGRVSINGVYFTVHPIEDYQPQHAPINEHENALYLDLPEHPPLKASVHLWAWASASERSLCIDPASIRKAVGMDYAPQDIIRQIADVTGQGLPIDLAERIQLWCLQAQGLTLKHMTVLTSPDRETMNRVRADWRLRPLLGQALSPHHIAVKPHFADKLCAKLERRDLPVTRHQETELTKPLAPDRDITHYLYLASEVYRRLGRVIPVDTKLTGAVITWIKNHLDVDQLDGLDMLVESTMDALNGAITGQLIAQGGVAQEDPKFIRQSIDYAYEECEAITIEYFSPASGQTTIRTIEPTMLYERNGASYIEAYCNLDQAERTFRIDRILRIIQSSMDASTIHEEANKITTLST